MVVTLGCKVNQAESAALERLELGGAVIVNTCAVTAEAGRKSRQAVRRALANARERGVKVYVTGCYATLAPEEITAMGAEILPKQPINVGGKPAERSRALLKIQDGCDNFCAYCVIPHLRGRSVSVPPGDVIAAVKRHEADGVAEAIVTGVEITSYGKEFSLSLGELLALLHEAAPSIKIQLGSLEPSAITAEFCRLLGELGCIAPKFHLSLQSGCDSVLKRMGRRYDTARFMEALTFLRENFDGCYVSTDVIVGFPGETDEEFEETFEFAAACRFDHMHVFPYSQRPGTAAASMPGQVEKGVKETRCLRLKNSRQSSVVSSQS